MLTRASISFLVAAYIILSGSTSALLDTSVNGGADGIGDSVELTASNDSGNDRSTGNAGASVAPDANHASPASNQPADPFQARIDTYCAWSPVYWSIDASDPAWDGQSPATGNLKWLACTVLFEGAPGAPGNAQGRAVQYEFFGNAAGALPPPPDPQELAERAVRELRVPAPQISAGPDRTKLAVNLWTWLWTDNPGALSATAAAGGVSVTATATLTSVTWTLGEPAPTGGPYAPGPPVTVTCQGAGTAPPAGYDWKAEPPCGHKYTWMSAKDRTGGTGTWPITATSNWNVTWASNTGVTGATTLSSTGNDALEIGEYRIVLVQGPGG